MKIARDESEVGTLRQRINGVQTWFFDLDDNHAPSPAKKIARRAIGTSHLSPKYLQWCASTALKLAKKEKAAESETWKDYVDSFLRNTKARAEVQRLFTPEYARQSLYPGVEDFCGLISDAQRFYVTRNIAEVVRVYASILNFDGFFAEANNKERIVEEYLQSHPHVERYGVEGDSEEDAGMIEILQFYKRDVVSLYSTDDPSSKINKRFDYSLSKDRTELVELLRKE